MSSMKQELCTWKGCENRAVVPKTASDGEVWANLCDYHDGKLTSAMNDPPRVLSFWVLAQGGKEAVVNRMLGEPQ